MIERPGSDSEIAWFIYRTRRKFHILRKHGTLFHQTPNQERRKTHQHLRLKNSRIRRRKLRHMFFYLRTGTLKRYNRRIEDQIIKIKEGPVGYERLAVNPIVHSATPAAARPGLTYQQRIRRMIRLARYVRSKSKSSNKSLPSDGRGKGWGHRPGYRKLRYLFFTGKLFKINFSAMGEFLNRNYSFLGKGKYMIIVLNSTFIFLLAYLFVFVLREIAMSLAAGSFDIRSVMMYYDVEYLIRSRDWVVEAVKVVFSTGPLLMFMLTVIGVTIFALSSNETWTVRLFIMWVILHSFTQSFGEIIFGSLLNQGFGWVLAYLYFSDTEKMLLVVGIMVGMIAVGLFLSRYILLTGNIYFNSISKTNRTPFLMSQILLPFLIGTGIILGIKQPIMNGFEAIVGVSMILVILPAILGARFKTDLFFDEEPRKIRIKWLWILVTLAVLILFRIFFWRGIRF
jgi:hypothetical protein